MGGYSLGAAFLSDPLISSPCTVRLSYWYLVETEMASPLRSLTTATTETGCTVESRIDGLGSGITCVSYHPSFCKVQCWKPVRIFPCIAFTSGNDGVPQGASFFSCLCRNNDQWSLISVALTSLQNVREHYNFSPCALQSDDRVLYTPVEASVHQRASVVVSSYLTFGSSIVLWRHLFTRGQLQSTMEYSPISGIPIPDL